LIRGVKFGGIVGKRWMLAWQSLDMGLYDRKQAMGTWLCGAPQVHPLILPDLNAFVALASYPVFHVYIYI
jgi:hypothetical protein